MMALARLLVALALMAPGAALTLDERTAARALLATPGQDAPTGEPPCIAFAPWGAPAEGVFLVAVPNDREEIVVALMRDGADGQPAILAGPASFEPITLGPLWACLLTAVEQAPLGVRPTIGIRVSNSYTSTGRSTSTAALHLLLVEGAVLRPVFGSLVSAVHSEGEIGGRRTGWTRRYQVERRPAPQGAMPEITIRDARTRRVVSRHRWRGEAYHPPVFDRFPPVGPG
ncbi:hypothetical protein [Neoroseomonas lacus]|uniref:Uncharacterized protein n=1 Tax=Neoroseomonas lacus TaxID=287609 RepID=A0A917K534_9PROT|nr:hypothetical protein [Neoroseomonas lacus]GGJ00368.1 hypothetical protein GCM10011320_03960 [Neoroseomonas lacus]